MGDMNRTLRDAFDRWKDALIDQDKQTTQAARHRAHARVTSMEDLIAETPADDIEGMGIKLALYVYMSGVDPEKADSAMEQVLSAYKDCRRVLGRDLLAEVKGLNASVATGHVRGSLVATLPRRLRSARKPSFPSGLFI
jgi:hypothetical protein